MTQEQQRAIDRLYKHKSLLTYQQYRTFRGQICSGDMAGFSRGLKRVLTERRDNG
jgi:hypothetical protein